jgi:hypothetical protein
MINDLKEFEKFLKICRKQGVTDVTLSGVSVKLGDLPVRGLSRLRNRKKFPQTSYHLKK